MGGRRIQRGAQGCLSHPGGDILRRAALPDVRAPALLIYSWADRTVRPDQGWEVYHRLGSADKVIHWLARSGHGIPEDIDREEAFEAVLRFLRRRIPER